MDVMAAVSSLMSGDIDDTALSTPARSLESSASRSATGYRGCPSVCDRRQS